MRNRLKKGIVAVLMIQVILFGIAIFGGNTIRRLSEAYLNILDNQVLVRKDYVQDEMIQRWSNLSYFKHYIQQQVDEIGVLDDSSLIPELLEKVVNRTISTLRQSGATEIFIILESEKGHEGIFLRDMDPSFNSINNSDILMERGPIDIARSLGIALDSEWSTRFKLSENTPDSEFYYQPFQAAKSYPRMAAKDLGYWSRPFRLSPEDMEIVTYSIPLLDFKGNPYGVIGTGLATDYLSRKLQYDELMDNKRGAYVLSVSKGDTTEEIVSSGPRYKMLADFLKSGSKNETRGVYASQQYLNLYNRNTPFEDDRWSLTGLVEKKDLFKPIYKIIQSIIISLIISLAFALMAVYVVGNWFMKPINKLMERVTKSNHHNPFQLVKTNIPEVDELGHAIETLNKEVLDSASKLSQIIDMVNVPIGAFEYQLSKDKAFCTNSLFEILGIEIDSSSHYASTLYLKELIQKITKNPEKGMDQIYRYQKEDGKFCWVQLMTQKQGDKVLGVIEDITDEVLLKRKIEYERDHDILTHLYNRRAFEVLVKGKIQKKLVGHSALAMWDLDNLKYINDTYGHEYGDQYIQKAASVLNRFTGNRVLVARMAGDEFYTFIYNYKEKDEARKLVNQIKEKLNSSFLKVPGGDSIRIRASVGIAWYPDDASNYEALIKYSDFAMYEVKNKDKGSILEFNKDTYNKNSILLYGKEELNDVIDHQLVNFAFQPIIHVETAEVFAYEALMRPQSKNLKSPYDVLRLADSQSKLYEIEKLTWFEAMATFKQLNKHFGQAKIFINSIPNYSLSTADLEKFQEKYKDYLDRIVIEITENEQCDEGCTKIKQEVIAKWGGELALDDFGSGYNNELSLLVLSPQYVKIDMNIIRGIDTDLNRQKLLKNILSYANNRDIKIIAEGVETRAEMEKLIEFGVDYMQGYYLGMPNTTPQPLNPQIKAEIQSSWNL